MITEQVTLTVTAGTEAGFETAFAAGSHFISDAPGCLSVELLRSTEAPSRYVLRVGWDSVADHVERYVGSTPHTELSAILGVYISDVLGSDHLERVTPG